MFTLRRVYFISSLVNFPPRRPSLGEKSSPSLVKVSTARKHKTDVLEPGIGISSSIFQWCRTSLSIQLLETAGGLMKRTCTKNRAGREEARDLWQIRLSRKEHNGRYFHFWHDNCLFIGIYRIETRSINKAGENNR